MPSAAALRAASVVPPRISRDLGVRQACDVVVRHRLALLVRQRRDRLPQVGVLGAGHAERGRRLGDFLDRRGLPLAGPQHVDGLAVRDRHEPRLGVGAVRQVPVGAQRGKEGLRPGVLGVVDAEEHPAYAQHRVPVLRHDLLERLLHARPHIKRAGLEEPR